MNSASPPFSEPSYTLPTSVSSTPPCLCFWVKVLWSPDLGTPRCYELAFSLSPQVVWPLILDTPRGPYPSPLSVLRFTGLMPQSSVYLQVLWPLVVDTPTVHVPALPATPGALPSDARHPRCPCPSLVTPRLSAFRSGHPPDAHVPVPQGLWPGAGRTQYSCR